MIRRLLTSYFVINYLLIIDSCSPNFNTHDRCIEYIGPEVFKFANRGILIGFLKSLDVLNRFVFNPQAHFPGWMVHTSPTQTGQAPHSQEQCVDTF